MARLVEDFDGCRGSRNVPPERVAWADAEPGTVLLWR
jgi:hypothetical protein